jgi:hypothetical protein
MGPKRQQGFCAMAVCRVRPETKPGLRFTHLGHDGQFGETRLDEFR